MDRRAVSRWFSALVLASASAMLLLLVLPRFGAGIAEAITALADGPNIDGIETFDVYYALRKTTLEDSALPPPFTRVRREPFFGRWQTSSGTVQIWVEGAHTESRLLYFIDDNPARARAEFDRATDG